MVDESRPVSRRQRRETEARVGGPETGGIAMGAPSTGAPSTGAPSTGDARQAPEIQAGFAFTSEMPISRVTAAVNAEEANSALSRRDRRRLERLDNPVETWTAEEEMRHTGQVPTMTPEVIAQQEHLARQQAYASQQDAHLASGEIPLAGRVAAGIPQANAEVVAPGGVPPSLQHLFPPPALGGPQASQLQQAQAPRQAPAQPSIDSHGRLIAPGGAQPMAVPGFADGGTGPGGVPVGNPPGQTPMGAPPPPVFGNHAAAFEAMVAGGPVPVQGKPPTVAVPQAVGPFQPPGPYGPPGMDPSGTMGGFGAPGTGQGLVVPGTGTLRNAQNTGTIRAIPGTGQIPRPVVEVQPAGGLRHFGWAHLALLAAAAFALGLVVYTVAAAQGS